MNSVQKATLEPHEMVCLCCQNHSVTDTVVGFRLCYKCLRANCRYKRVRCKGPTQVRPQVDVERWLEEDETGVYQGRDIEALGRPRIVRAWAGMRSHPNGRYFETVALVQYDRIWSKDQRNTLYRSSFVGGNTRTLHRVMPEDTPTLRYWQGVIRDWKYRGFQPVPFHDPRYASIPLGIEGYFLPTPGINTGPASLHALPIARWQQNLMYYLRHQCVKRADERHQDVLLNLIGLLKLAEKWRTVYYDTRGLLSGYELGDQQGMLHNQGHAAEKLLHYALSVEEAMPKESGPFPYLN